MVRSCLRNGTGDTTSFGGGAGLKLCGELASRLQASGEGDAILGVGGDLGLEGQPGKRTVKRTGEGLLDTKSRRRAYTSPSVIGDRLSPPDCGPQPALRRYRGLQYGDGDFS